MTDGEISALHAIGSAGLLPDLTVLIEVDAAAIAARLARRDGDVVDRIGGRDAAFHALVAAAFAAMAEAEPARLPVSTAMAAPTPRTRRSWLRSPRWRPHEPGAGRPRRSLA